MSNLLIDDGQLLILETKLAVLIGDRPAIALQQIHYWIEINRKQKKEDHFFDGAWWVYNTWAEWHEGNFPFWSERTVRRIFDDLAKPENERPILIITRPHENSSKGNWIRIDYEAWSNWLGTVDKMTSEGGQNVQTLSTTENTKKITTEKPRKRGVVDFAHVTHDALIDAYYDTTSAIVQKRHTANRRNMVGQLARFNIHAAHIVEYLNISRQQDQWRGGAYPSFDEMCKKIVAWYEHRAKSKPAQVPAASLTGQDIVYPDADSFVVEFGIYEENHHGTAITE